MYHTPREKYEIKRQEASDKRYEEARRRIEAGEKASEEDKLKTIKKYDDLREEIIFIKKQKQKQALKEESDSKRLNAYNRELKRLEWLRKPPYKGKRELTGNEAGEIALQRQRETEILSEKLLKQETEKTEAWRESERIRVAKQTEDNRVKRLETEQHTKEFTEAISFKKNPSMDIHKLYNIKKKGLLEMYKGHNF